MICPHCNADAGLLFACPRCHGLVPPSWEAARLIWEARADTVEQFQICDLLPGGPALDVTARESEAIKATQRQANEWGRGAYLYRLASSSPRRRLVAALIPDNAMSDCY
jgi:hypothetical protein